MTSFTNIPIKQKTKDRFIAVEKEFLSHHPEFKHIRLSYDILLNKLIDWYLKS